MNGQANSLHRRTHRLERHEDGIERIESIRAGHDEERPLIRPFPFASLRVRATLSPLRGARALAVSM